MNITVIGTGYVGLVTGTCLADRGSNVTCVDIDEDKIEALKQGHIPIYEPGLSDLVIKNSSEGRLHFTTNLAAAPKAELVFMALPTPPGADGAADLRFVLVAAEQLAAVIGETTCVVVNKSTVPVGTADKVQEIFTNSGASGAVVVSNPEFLREGFAVKDFMHPDRIVVGTDNVEAKRLMTELYQPFIDEHRPLIFTDLHSSELAKYAANSFLALKISFINEIANLSERVGANVDDVAKIIGLDERIGRRFLQAGIGYGGSCFPKDVSALKSIAKQHDYNFRLLDAVIEVNTQQKSLLCEKVFAHFGMDLSGKRFALWGLAFKPDTDDTRGSPAHAIIKTLTEAGAEVTGYDPEASKHMQRVYETNERVNFVNDMYEAVESADALLIATEWPIFAAADLARLKALLKSPTVFDGRNIYSLLDMSQNGFSYYSIGRP